MSIPSFNYIVEPLYFHYNQGYFCSNTITIIRDRSLRKKHRDGLLELTKPGFGQNPVSGLGMNIREITMVENRQDVWTGRVAFQGWLLWEKRDRYPQQA